MEIISTLFSDGKIYVLIYLLLFFFSLFGSSKQYSRLSKPMAWITMFIMTLFIGLRWETGTDWEPYKKLFDTLELDWTFLINIYHFDIGYVIFNALVKLFFDNYTIFLVINAFITIYLLYRLVVKISPYPNLSLFLFYTAFMIAQFMGSNRRMMAMVFILWSFYFLYEKRKLAFFVMIGLAFLFHRSSLVCLIVYFIPKKIVSFRYTLLLLISALFIGLLQLPAKLIELTGLILSSVINHPIVEKMLFYSENGEEHLVSGTGNIVLSTILAIIKRAIFLVFYIYIIRKNKVSDITQYFYNIYIYGFAGYLFFVGSFFQIMTAYFAFIEILLIGLMYNYADSKLKKIFLIILFLYGLLQMFNALNVYPELYIPYISVFSNITR